jgi:hypothetical protein
MHYILVVGSREGIDQHFGPLAPHAIVTFDRFHVIKLMNERLDDLRRELAREAQDHEAKEAIKRLRWLLLHRHDNLEKDAARRLQLEYRLEISHAQFNPQRSIPSIIRARTSIARIRSVAAFFGSCAIPSKIWSARAGDRGGLFTHPRCSLLFKGRFIASRSYLQSRQTYFARQYPNSVNLSRIPETVIGIGSSRKISLLSRA